MLFGLTETPFTKNCPMRQKRQQAVDIFTEYLINNKCCGSIQRGAVVIFLPSCRMPVAIEEKNPPYKNNNGTFPSPNRSDGILLTIKSKPHCLSNSLTNLRVSTKDTLSLFFVFFCHYFCRYLHLLKIAQTDGMQIVMFLNGKDCKQSLAAIKH